MNREKIEALEEALDKVLRVRDLYTVEYTSTWSSESKEILKKLAEVQFTLMDIKSDERGKR